MSNIVHQYFKKELQGTKKLIQVNPIQFTGIEITILPSGEIEANEMEENLNIIDFVISQGYKESSPLEFNLYFSGTITGGYKNEESI
jgi:cytoplasmic iron level regulating protein YaaA (DUF328/UPF0246 family)